MSSNRNSKYALARGFAAIALVVLVANFAGCVQRRLTVRSDPPGAVVYIDNHRIGVTPVATDYVYYGTRQFRLEKDGFETIHVERFIPPPWYQFPPLDFVTENIVPGEIRDERLFSFKLNPQVIVPRRQLLDRANGLRLGSRPLAPTLPQNSPLPALSNDPYSESPLAPLEPVQREPVPRDPGGSIGPPIPRDPAINWPRS